MQQHFKLKNTLLCLSLSTIFAAFGLQAHEMQHQAPHKIMQQLDLATQQKQAMHTVMMQSKQDAKVLKQELKPIKQQLKQVIQAEQWDQQQAVDLIQQKQALEAQIALNRASKRNAVWNILELEQQQRFDSLTEKVKGKHSDKAQGKGKHRQVLSMRRFARLDLTEQQKTQIADLLAIQKQQMQDLAYTRKEHKQAQRALIHSTEFDQQAWLASHQQMQAVHLDTAVSFAHTRHQIWNLLTAQQQQKMIRMQNKRIKQHQRRHA
jgi:Spy/CpxP family protein refolding chaperone